MWRERPRGLVAALAEGAATGACCPAVGPACAGSWCGPLRRAAGRPYPERQRLLARAQRLGLGLDRVWALLGRASLMACSERRVA